MQDKINLIDNNEEISDTELPKPDPAPAIKSTPLESTSKIIGRQKEIKKIDEFLNENHVLFISAAGGYGKTQLTLLYISEYILKYNLIIFAKYETDLTQLIISDKYFDITGFSRNGLESDTNYAKRKLNKLSQLTDENDLIVIDNFDTMSDILLKDLCSLPCKILITTRTDFSYLENYNQYKVGNLEPEDQEKLFKEIYKKDISESDNIFLKKILEYISGHTLTIVLLARVMTKHRISFNSILQTLQEKGISPDITGDISFNTEGKNTVYNHISKLMRIDQLNSDRLSLMIMNSLSLLPLSGIPANDFITWCELNDYNKVNDLIERGWITLDDNQDIISLHPVIGDIIRNNMKNPFNNCKKMLSSLSRKFARNWEEMQVSERLRYVEYAKSLYYKLPHKITDSKKNIDKNNFLLFKHIALILSFCQYYEICDELISEMISQVGSNDSIELSWLIFEFASIKARKEGFSKAEHLYLDAINIMNRVNPNSYDLAFLLKQLAYNYHDLYYRSNEQDVEKLNAAEEYLKLSDSALQESISHVETKYGSYIISERYNHATTIQAQKASHLTNWAFIKYYKGNYDDALSDAHEAYNLFLNISGNNYNNTDIHSSMQVLSRIHSRQNNFDEAEKIIRKVIESRKQIWGTDSRYYWRMIELYSFICYENKKINQSIELLYEIQKLMNGKEESHSDYANLIKNKISFLLNENNNDNTK